MKIVTWNFRCQWDQIDGKNSVIHRAGFAYDKIQKEKPDVVAFQEIREITLELLQKMLPEYEFFGSQRTANFGQEGLYVAWRKESCALMGGEVFWLSPTPYTPGSRFDNQSECSRVCVMAKIRDKKTNETYRVWDVHLDHISDEARREGLNCLFTFVDRYSKVDSTPHVVLGDFNATPNSDTMRSCGNESGLVDVTDNLTATFHDFGKCGEKIDYVFVSEGISGEVKEVVAWTDEHDGVYLSDHYPISVTLRKN